MVVQGQRIHQKSLAQGDMNSVMASLAMLLKSIGLLVQWNSWSIATDSQGIVLRLPWVQHHYGQQGAVGSGIPDTGPRRAYRKKTPSKEKRDRLRWEQYQAKRASKISQGRESAAKNGNSGAFVNEATVDRVVQDNAPQESEHRNAATSDLPRSSTVGPAAVNVVTEHLKVDAMEVSPRNNSDESIRIDTGLKSVNSVSTETYRVICSDITTATEYLQIANVASQYEATDTVAAPQAVDIATLPSKCEVNDNSLNCDKNVRSVCHESDHSVLVRNVNAALLIEESGKTYQKVYKPDEIHLERLIEDNEPENSDQLTKMVLCLAELIKIESPFKAHFDNCDPELVRYYGVGLHWRLAVLQKIGSPDWSPHWCERMPEELKRLYKF